jgi:hypothetical protein
MEDLLKKISEYQLFNFLLSGAVLVVALDKTTAINLTNENVVASIFTFYFVGLIASRIGSLIVEPLLKNIGVVKFAPYPDYLVAVKKDPKIDTLSQENNTYRTLIAVLILFILTYILINNSHNFFAGKHDVVVYVLAIAILTLFVLAYRKQTAYITKRIKSTNAK